MKLDFSGLHKRFSTWISAAQGAAGLSLAAYTQMPKQAQDTVPSLVLAALGGILLLAPWLVPLATSYQQKNLPPKQ
jgi:hypothetical protein